MKKKIPLGIRKILDEVSSKAKELISIELNKGIIITLKDRDLESDYFFCILGINPHNAGKITYQIEYKPYNEETLSVKKINATLLGMKSELENWLKLLEESNKESLLFEDQITQKYYDDLEPKFEILDNDAYIKPYSIEQQKQILLYLDKASEFINNSELKNKTEIEEINYLIVETKETISNSTKKQVVEKIRKIVAKTFKISLQIGEKLLVDFAAELTKKMITGN
ncbi:MAG: hypothetical protein HXX16_05485 [Bacteroidales bacterium]|nr:hypothetical protein [Bacteroidales bacterium]